MIDLHGFRAVRTKLPDRLVLPSLWASWPSPRRGRCLVGVDQAVVVAVEAVELVARAQELTAGDVAVVVAVHLLKPVRAGRRARRLGSRPSTEARGAPRLHRSDRGARRGRW